jgi:hypothetical protein
MFDKFKSFFARPEAQAAIALPPPEVPKVRSRDLISTPSYIGGAATKGAQLPLTDRRLLTTNLTDYRFSADTRTSIRQFVAASPDLSSAVFSYLRLAITRSYTAVAHNLDGTFNEEGTRAAQQLLTRFDLLGDYSDGFSGTYSIRSVSESMGKDLLQTGACACELVLDKSRLPKRIQPLAASQIRFIPDGKILRPVQVTQSDEINLDVPTFFYVSLDQDLLDPYASSPLEPALRPVLASEDFQNDLRRIVKRVIHPRLKITVDEEAFMDALSQEEKASEEKVAAARGNLISTLTSYLSNLAPEDAVVFFDSLDVGILNNGNISLASEYQALSSLLDAKMATGAKAMPAILGHGTQSANIASTETMLFAKAAEGAIQAKLNEMYSRILTLAVRLLGIDCTVEFSYEPVDLRPKSEMEAFKQAEQSRLAELLSMGFISDEEFGLKTTGKLPPAGHKPLSGTMFRSAQAQKVEDPTSNGGSALNQSQQSDMPTQSRGQNNKANPLKEPAK